MDDFWALLGFVLIILALFVAPIGIGLYFANQEEQQKRAFELEKMKIQSQMAQSNAQMAQDYFNKQKAISDANSPEKP